MEDTETQEPDVETCDHEYVRVSYAGLGCYLYRCPKCGDEYERDVS